MTLHKNLANSELHEAKGVASANDQELYWADGAGSGDWAPLVATAGSWTHSSDVSEVEFTGLGDYAMLQIDIAGITLSTATNQHVFCQVGNDSGYSTSAIYYDNRWSSNTEGNQVLTGIPCVWIRNNSPANSMINLASVFLTNFNRGATTIGYSQEVGDDSTTNQAAFVNRVLWIREQKAYNKIRFRTTDNMTAGTIIVSGYRWAT